MRFPVVLADETMPAECCLATLADLKWCPGGYALAARAGSRRFKTPLNSRAWHANAGALSKGRAFCRQHGRNLQPRHTQPRIGDSNPRGRSGKLAKTGSTAWDLSLPPHLEQ